MNTLIVNVRSRSDAYHARCQGKRASASCCPQLAVRACAAKCLPAGAEIVAVELSQFDATRATWCVTWRAE